MPEYLVVRCHGLATHLLPKQVMEALASSKNIKDFADMLSPTDYGGRMRELKDVNAYSLEQVFFDEFVAKCRFVAAVASGAMQDFLRAYFRRLEVQALSRILRVKMSKPSGEIKPHLTSMKGLTDLRLDRMLDAEDVESAVELLKDTCYSPVAKSLDWYREYNSMLPLEFHLRKVYYTMMLEAMRNLPGGDRERIGRLLGIEVDVANCFTVVAPVLYGYSAELSKQLIIPHFFRLVPSKVKEVTEAKSPHAVLPLLRSYEEVVKPLLEENDECLGEVRALNLILKEARKQMLEASVDFAYATCYLALCEIERRNLTLIAYLTQQNLQVKGYLAL